MGPLWKRGLLGLWGSSDLQGLTILAPKAFLGAFSGFCTTALLQLGTLAQELPVTKATRGRTNSSRATFWIHLPSLGSTPGTQGPAWALSLPAETLSLHSFTGCWEK
jgi:hypothetical protein